MRFQKVSAFPILRMSISISDHELRDRTIGKLFMWLLCYNCYSFYLERIGGYWFFLDIWLDEG